MASNKTRIPCDACGHDVGLWQAAFTSECAHTFHIRCVSGSGACPVCKAQWKDTPAVAPAPPPATPFSFAPCSSRPSSMGLFGQQTTATTSSFRCPTTPVSPSGSVPQTMSSSSLFGSSSSSSLFGSSTSSLFVSSPAFGSSSSPSLFGSSTSSLTGSSPQTTSRSSPPFTFPSSVPSFGTSLFGPQPSATPNPFWSSPVPPVSESCSTCNHTFHLRCFSGSVCPVCGARWRDEVTVTRSSQLNPSSAPSPPSWFHPPDPSFTFTPVNPCPTPPFASPSFPSLSSLLALFNFNDDEPVEPPLEGWDTVPEFVHNGVLVLKMHCEYPAVVRDAAQENFAVMVHAKAPVAPAEASERAPLDLVTVLDVSSSMEGDKISLVKQAMGFVIDKLGPSDRLSVVTFSCSARRIIRLTRMSDDGKASARAAVESLRARGSTNIRDGLRVATQVLDGRRHKNTVSSVILLSDGEDNHTLDQGLGWFGRTGGHKSYMDLVPHSLRRGDGQLCTPVHTFGFGTDHDARAMHAIAEVTGGTFSFIENQAVVQDSLAQCIGGLLSVAVQEARIAVECLHPGVRVRAVKSGGYQSHGDADGHAASVDVGELYAEEERRFLLLVDVPIAAANGAERGDVTRLIKASCTYKDAATGRSVDVASEDAVVQRPAVVNADTEPSVEVARERFRVEAAEDIASARAAAERGHHAEAARILDRRQEASAAAGLSGDARCAALVAELRELSARVANRREYEQTGRAFVLAGMSSHAQQRASTVQLFGAAGSSEGFGAAPTGNCSSSPAPSSATLFCAPASFGATASGFKPQAGGFSSCPFGSVVDSASTPDFGAATPAISSSPPPRPFGSATMPPFGATTSCFTFGYATPAMQSMVDSSRKTREQQQQQ